MSGSKSVIRAIGREKVDKQKKRIDRMNSSVVRIDLGEKESVATYMAPDRDIGERFKFQRTPDGYRVFAGKMPRGIPA